MAKNTIVIKGAREHNLKNIDIELPRDKLIVFTGLSGSGKSTLARAVAHELPGCCGARVLRTDVIRKRLAGATPHDRLAEDSYRFTARASVYDALASRARSTAAFCREKAVS